MPEEFGVPISYPIENLPAALSGLKEKLQAEGAERITVIRFKSTRKLDSLTADLQQGPVNELQYNDVITTVYHTDGTETKNLFIYEPDLVAKGGFENITRSRTKPLLTDKGWTENKEYLAAGVRPTPRLSYRTKPLPEHTA